MVASLSSTFTGVVASVNAKGLRLDGHESWLNVSKFAPDVVLPERGQTVTVAVDSKGFLRSCELVSGPYGAPEHQNGSGATSTTNGRSGATSGQHERDRTITRLAVLKAAAEFGSSRPDLKSGDVLRIAASWERWVNRSDDPTEDLTEAF